MRLWTLHPRYLDAAGLVALWREALLAQAVLKGKTRGYRSHPQLQRFRSRPDPAASVAAYLHVVHEQAQARGYAFQARKIGRRRDARPIPATRGQLEFEWQHLLRKLRSRDPDRYRALRALRRPRAHPLFRIKPGGVADWESI